MPKSFKTAWIKAADHHALLPNSRDSYWFWAKRFWHFTAHNASEWTGLDWENFELHLIKERYSYSARRQARNALAFIFRRVLQKDVGKLNLPVIPKPESALVVVPTREELSRIFAGLHGQERLACRIMHGSGTRVEETCRIRVQDVDLERASLRVWDGKGEHNRLTVLPHNLIPVLEKQVAWRMALHERDLADGNGFVELPGRLSRKMRGAERELGWQWLLASSQIVKQRRWYLSPDCVSRAVLCARRAAGIIKRITCHSFRKAFADELHRLGTDVRTIQALLGHADLRTTAMHYLAIHLENAFSPADVASTQLEAAPSPRIYQLTEAAHGRPA